MDTWYDWFFNKYVWKEISKKLIDEEPSTFVVGKFLFWIFHKWTVLTSIFSWTWKKTIIKFCKFFLQIINMQYNGQVQMSPAID